MNKYIKGWILEGTDQHGNYMQEEIVRGKPSPTELKIIDTLVALDEDSHALITHVINEPATPEILARLHAIKGW